MFAVFIDVFIAIEQSVQFIIFIQRKIAEEIGMLLLVIFPVSVTVKRRGDDLEMRGIGFA